MISPAGNRFLIGVSGLLLALSGVTFGQTPRETPPPPSEPPMVNIPAIKEMRLPNGLSVVVVERKGIPLVTVSLLVNSGGARGEEASEAGLASMTASLLVKGTATRSATEIADEIEFPGASIGSGANWNSSTITVNVTKNGLGKALSLMSDSVIRPGFPAKEIRLAKKQALDGFRVSLKNPGALLSYVSSRYSFGEHLTGGTPVTIKRINRKAILNFHKSRYWPSNSVLIFTGDISESTAFGFARLFFGGWENGQIMTIPTRPRKWKKKKRNLGAVRLLNEY